MTVLSSMRFTKVGIALQCLFVLAIQLTFMGERSPLWLTAVVLYQVALCLTWNAFIVRLAHKDGRANET